MKGNRTSEEILDAIKLCIPFVKQLVPNDLSVSLFVDGVCQAVTPGEHINLGLEISSEMADDSGLISATQKKCAIHNVLPREIFGMAVEGELVPVLDADNNVLCMQFREARHNPIYLHLMHRLKQPEQVRQASPLLL